MKPIRRKVWAKKGKQPISLVNPDYEWLWVYAFCCPQTGRNFCWVMTHFDADSFEKVLEAFARAANKHGKKRIVLVQDQAGQHKRKKTQIPKGIELKYLPPKSPELQPAEVLWQFIDEVVANEGWRGIKEIQAVVERRCVWLEDQLKLVRCKTLFRWWPII
jgi:DDE superfamily endonuclease